MRHSSRTRVGRRMDRYIESARTAALCLVHMVAVVVHIEVVLGNVEIGERCTAEELAVYMRVGSFALAQTAQLGAAAQTPSAVGCPNPSFK